jgi:hypothetical protein
MNDGLGMLDQQRERRVRRIPAAKNPPRTKPVALPQPVQEHLPAPAEPEPSRDPKKAATKAIVEPTVKMSIYLEPDDDLYLENIVHAGKTSRPRVAISRSAIVRLALEKLATTMTVDQIVDVLRDRGAQHQGTGRKRR